MQYSNSIKSPDKVTNIKTKNKKHQSIKSPTDKVKTDMEQDESVLSPTQYMKGTFNYSRSIQPMLIIK